MAKKKKKKTDYITAKAYAMTEREHRITDLFPADCENALKRLKKPKKSIIFNDILKEILKEHSKKGLTYPKGIRNLLFG